MTLGIEWAEPRALGALALALPIVALHLYRRRRRRLEVAFVPLLREASGPARPLSGWRRLADRASLALRLLALACLALAWAGPRAAAAAAPKDLVVVLDADVTTRALDRPGGRDDPDLRLERDPVHELDAQRFQRQSELARAWIRTRAGARVAVVVAAATPRVVVPWTSRLDAAIDGVGTSEPARGRADLASAIRVARGLAEQAAAAEIVVVTSRPVAAQDAGAVRVVGAGSSRYDQGIVDVAWRPAESAGHATVRFVVRDVSGSNVRRALEWSVEGRRTGVQRRDVDLAGGAETNVDVDVDASAGATVVGRLAEPYDALAEDDAAAIVVPRLVRPSVLVVHGGTPRPYVAALLEAMGDSIDRERSGLVSVAEVAHAARRDVVIADGVAPGAAPPASGIVYLAPFGAGPDASSFPFRVGKEVREPVVWRVDASHALLRGVDLSPSYVARATTLVGGTPIAQAEGGTVVAEGQGRGVSWVAIGLDPDGSDLPLRAALPVLLRNAIERVVAVPSAPLAPAYRAGEPIAPRLPWPDDGPVRIEARTLGVPLDGRGPGPAPGLLARLPVFGAEAATPPAPPGGPWRIEVISEREGGPRHVSVSNDLDRERDITPARPPMSPAAVSAEGGGAPASFDPDALRRLLLWIGGAALLADVVLLALRTRNVAPAPVPA